jgi:hypothetical protein
MTDDYRWQLNVVGWTLCSIAIVVVFARSYCRFFVIHSFGADDALMVLSMVRFLHDALVLFSHILGSWYCYDSIGVYRCDPRLWSASCGYQEPVRSETSFDVQLYRSVGLDCGINVRESIHGVVPCAIARSLGQKTTPMAPIWYNLCYDWAQLFCDWYPARWVLTYAEVMDTYYARDLHSSKHV